MRARHAMRSPAPRPVAAVFVGLVLAASAAWAAPARAVDQPSTYPGCATRELRVPWGGAATVDLRDCQAFGLGTVARAPEHGTATPGDAEPVESYTYSHAGRTPAGGGGDSFVVLDDNSDHITVRVSIEAPSGAAVATDAGLPPLRVGLAVDVPVTATGLRAPLRWSLDAGALPAGLALDAAGRLQGTPTTRGPYAFTLAVADAGGQRGRLSFGGEVAPGDIALRPDRAEASPGQPFSIPLSADGGLPPYRFQAEVPANLPAGVSLSPQGVLSGLNGGPARAYVIKVRITDASAGPGEFFVVRDFTLALGRVPTVTLTAPVAAVAEDEAEGLSFVVARDAVLDAPTDVLLRASGSARLAGGKAGGLWRVRIPAGARETTVTIRPRADGRAEGDETVALELVPAGGYVVGSPARADGTLVDDDAP